MAPPGWYRTDHDLAERSALYVTAATELSARAAGHALARAGLTPADVDVILYVNTTGLATPSIDARLVNALGLRADVRRLPLWGLGCAGGAAGLSHAHHLALGDPSARILVIATELCGLTFMADDPTKSNLVATALFADGAAAAVVTGDTVPGGGLEILGTQSRFYPDSLDVMGWTVLQKGLQVVFQRRIPDIVRDHAATDLGGFLARHGLALADVDAFLFHPGGAKVIEAYEAALGLAPTDLDWTRGVLRDYGNMSSTTVLFVIERYLAAHGSGRGGQGLVSALGPGFCSESLLLGL
ncbi:MAG: 3-oxoacyl-[acyl-carrier-protein] synthase III C-terminal domain-containing protein [Candidatus Krumholzibacteriia bacterium]